MHAKVIVSLNSCTTISRQNDNDFHRFRSFLFFVTSWIDTGNVNDAYRFNVLKILNRKMQIVIKFATVSFVDIIDVQGANESKT